VHGDRVPYMDTSPPMWFTLDMPQQYKGNRVAFTVRVPAATHAFHSAVARRRGLSLSDWITYVLRQEAADSTHRLKLQGEQPS